MKWNFFAKPETIKPATVPYTDGRVLPRAISTGSTRGTQTIGYGSIKLDGSNNRITVGTDSSSVILGDISDLSEEFGFSVSDESNVRLLAGKYPDGDIKIKLSQTGYDVTTATDNQLIWSSDFNSFKIALTGTAITTTTAVPWATGSGSDIITIPHNLGYVPVPLLYYTTGGSTYTPVDGNFNMAFSNGVNSSWSMTNRTIVTTDITNLTIIIQQLGSWTGVMPGGNINSSQTLTFKYYLLRETAS